MTSLRHNGVAPTVDDAISRGLDAARESILAVGWRRTTLTDVARRAGVSRMTMYRRWPDMQTLLADLMTREWAGVVASPGSPRPGPSGVADQVVATVVALRGNPLFRKIVEVDPELLLPYLLDRRGRAQDTMLDLLAAGIADGQQAGELRAGDPTTMARSVLLAAHGFALSAPTMADASAPSVQDLDAELRALVEHYLSR